MSELTDTEVAIESDGLYTKRIILLNDGAPDQIRAVAKNLADAGYFPQIIFHRSDEQVAEYDVLHDVFKQAEILATRAQNPNFGRGQSELRDALRTLGEDKHTVLVATNMTHFQMCFAFFAGLGPQDMAPAEACILEQPSDAQPATWPAIADQKARLVFEKRIPPQTLVEAIPDPVDDIQTNTGGGLLASLLNRFFKPEPRSPKI